MIEAQQTTARLIQYQEPVQQQAAPMAFRDRIITPSPDQWRHRNYLHMLLANTYRHIPDNFSDRIHDIPDYFHSQEWYAGKGFTVSLSSVIEEKLDISLTPTSTIREPLRDLTTHIITWWDSWVHEDSRIPDIDLTTPHFGQIFTPITPDQRYDPKSQWNTQKFVRFLYAKGSTVKEAISQFLHVQTSSLLSQWMRNVNPVEISSNQAARELLTMTNSPDIDLVLYPGMAFGDIVKELAHDQLNSRMLGLEGSEQIPMPDTDEKMHWIMQSLTVSQDDICVPKGWTLASPNVHIAYSVGLVPQKPTVEYASYELYVEVYDTLGNVHRKPLMTLEITPDPVSAGLVDENSRIGYMPPSFDSMTGYIQNPGKPTPTPHRTNGEWLMACNAITVQTLLVPNTKSEYMNAMESGDIPIDQTFVLQQFGRILRDGICAWPISMQRFGESLHFPGYHQAVMFFKQMNNSVSLEHVDRSIVQELENNIRKSWILDSNETLQFLVDTGFLRFFPLLQTVRKRLESARSEPDRFFRHDSFRTMMRKPPKQTYTDNQIRSSWRDDISNVRQSFQSDPLQFLSDFELFLKITSTETL